MFNVSMAHNFRRDCAQSVRPSVRLDVRRLQGIPLPFWSASDYNLRDIPKGCQRISLAHSISLSHCCTRGAHQHSRNLDRPCRRQQIGEFTALSSSAGRAIISQRKVLALCTMAFLTACAFVPSRRTKTNVSRIPRANYVLSPRMGLRAVENYDGSFKLAEEVDEALNSMLLDANLSEYVSKQAKRESAEYMGILFQPTPYSVATPHGMPKEVEQYYNNPDFAIINVPPQIMFNAKCYNPSRLCAVFRLQGGVREEPTFGQGPANAIDWSGIGDAIRNPVQDTDDDDTELVV